MKTKKHKKNTVNYFFISWGECKRGFSIVEVIVAVTIMAIVSALLAPSLLTHVERSRAAKDFDAMDKVTDSIRNGLVRDNIYDEITAFSKANNVSCYIDSHLESNYSPIVSQTSNGQISHYTFDNNSRMASGVAFSVAGNMKGMTITFEPVVIDGKSVYKLQNGVINKYITENNDKLSDLPELYAEVRLIIGDVIYSNSQTYKNSEFTVFIDVGSSGGNDANNKSGFHVYGQYGGTNLTAGMQILEAEDRNIGRDENINNDTSGAGNQNPNDNIVDDGTTDLPVDKPIYEADFVFIISNASLGKKMMNDVFDILQPKIEEGHKMRFGVVTWAETGDLVKGLTEINSKEQIDAFVLDTSEALGEQSVNMEHALLTTKQLLEQDTLTPSNRKYVFMASTGLTYAFDNENGVTSMVMMKDTANNIYYGDRCWKYFRNANTSSYLMPSAYTTWSEYWTDICKWVEQDQHDYEYSFTVSWTDFLANNQGSTNRKSYGQLVTYPSKTYGVENAVPYFAAKSNPKTVAKAQHAILYERAQYDAWIVWEQMKTPKGQAVISVLKDENGNSLTYNGLGYNCYSVYCGLSANSTIGYLFMEMLGDGDVTFYSNDYESEDAANMFAAKADELLNAFSD